MPTMNGTEVRAYMFTAGLLALALAFHSGPARPGAPPADRRAAPAPAARPGTPASGTAGLYRVLVERVVQSASLVLDFTEPRKEPDDEGKQTVYVHLLVTAPERDQACAIAALGEGLAGVTDSGQKLELRPYAAPEAGPADGRSWRACLLAQDVDVRARALKEVTGELVVYPKSRAIRVEFSTRNPLPQTKTIDGVRVTLHEYQFANQEAKVVVSEQWPAGATLGRLRDEVPFGVTAAGGTGVPAIASEGRAETVDAAGAAPGRRLQLLFTDLAAAPNLITVEALLRSGAPQTVPF